MDITRRAKYNLFLGRVGNYRKNVRTLIEDVNNIKENCENWGKAKGGTPAISLETGMTIDNVVDICKNLDRRRYPWKRDVQHDMFDGLFSIIDEIETRGIGKKDEDVIRGYLSVVLKYMESFVSMPFLNKEEIDTAMKVAPEFAKLEGVERAIREVNRKICNIRDKKDEKDAEKDKVYRRLEQYPPDALPKWVENQMKEEIANINLDLNKLNDSLDNASKEMSILDTQYQKSRLFVNAYQQYETFFTMVGRYKITNIDGREYADLIQDLAIAREREENELQDMLATARLAGSEEKIVSDVDAEFEEKRREYSERTNIGRFDVPGQSVDGDNYANNNWRR